MAASPAYITLAADTEQTVTLDANYAAVEVTLVSGAATTYFNAKNVAIGAVAGAQDGNHVLNTSMPSKIVRDETTGNTVVHLRSSGTPTVCVAGL